MKRPAKWTNERTSASSSRTVKQFLLSNGKLSSTFQEVDLGDKKVEEKTSIIASAVNDDRQNWFFKAAALELDDSSLDFWNSSSC